MPRIWWLYLIAFIVLSAAFLLRLSFSKADRVLPKGQKLVFNATVLVEPKIGDKNQIIAVADLQIYTDLFPKYEVGDRLRVSGEVTDDGKIFYPEIAKVAKKASFLALLASFRQKISENFGSFLPTNEATIIQGTVLGVDNIGSKLREELVKTGTIHVVVVSGQNLAIVAGVFISMAKYIGRRKSLVLACGAVVIYALIAGFAPPVTRALIMVVAATIAIYFGREVWPIWNLMLAAMLIIFIWPQALFEISFQLTFAASLGIMTLGKSLTKLINGTLVKAGPVTTFPSAPSINSGQAVLRVYPERSRRAAGNLSSRATRIFFSLFGESSSIAISAYLFTLPVIVFYFGRVSPLAPIVNILVAEAVLPIMVLGFLVALASLIFMPLGQLLAFLAFVPAFYFVKVVEFFARLPLGQVDLGEGNLVLVVILYLVILATTLTLGRRHGHKS